MSNALNISNIIDTHRPANVWSGNHGRTIECTCGHKSTSEINDFLDTMLTAENNPQRTAERAHADHVAHMVSMAAQGESTEMVDVTTTSERKRPVKAVQRSQVTKYQVSAIRDPHDYTSLVTADLLRDVAKHVGGSGSVPTQIKIDRAPVEGKDWSTEKITLTWFA